MTSNQAPPLPEPYLKMALALLREQGEAQWLPVTGRSMVPLIWPGDQVRVTAAWQPAARGDILTFLQDGQLNTHRLLRSINVGGQWVYVTKGDNQWQPDPPLNEADIVGRVEAVRRGERSWGPNGRFWRWSNRYLTQRMFIQTRLYPLLHPFYHWLPLRLLAALYRRLRLLPWWLLRALTGRR
ncbi:MAG: S24/S26 family peptidase [Chloroflexota bacterium]